MRRYVQLIVPLLLAAQLVHADPVDWAGEWPNTDFSRTGIADWSEIRSGGPPRDGIPALDQPEFYGTASDNQLQPAEPVITVAIEGAEERAYPVRYLIWHEIVNDLIGDVPVAVTFCPLCNSGITFDRRTDAGVLSFGVSGKLRYSDMIMFDRETESWWQQAIGAAIVGQLAGTSLQMLPGWMESWQQFKDRNGDDGLVMKQPQLLRPYGRNPYQGYDTAQKPFLYDGELPPFGISAVERVVRVGNSAWPITRVRAAGMIEEAGVTISWEAGQASALDSAVIAEGRDVGSIRVRDAQGNDVAHDVLFAFAFHAFWPDGKWMIGG